VDHISFGVLVEKIDPLLDLGHVFDELGLLGLQGSEPGQFIQACLFFNVLDMPGEPALLEIWVSLLQVLVAYKLSRLVCGGL